MLLVVKNHDFVVQLQLHDLSLLLDLTIFTKQSLL